MFNRETQQEKSSKKITTKHEKRLREKRVCECEFYTDNKKQLTNKAERMCSIQSSKFKLTKQAPKICFM